MKTLLSGLAIAITFFAFIPYIKSIISGHTRPHVFSWIIWGSTTLIVFFAQLQDGAGIGAWPIGVSGVITLLVAWLAYRYRADYSITRTDQIFMLMAILSLPLWYFTANPLWAVILLTFVDLLGFGPTFRKAFYLPYQENIGFFSLFALRNLLVVLALEHYSVTTTLFPAATGFACVLLIMLIVQRRYSFSR
ncbi:hypothetical protein MPL1_10012 [Methylophaga lonarensis MPL]|uniref:Uncharacterized protein n=1 Tax=Methylophaga lonarensis MPL TaxID=1286106 RepID=M7NUQ3_9GAMM|nr:hypothetical protein [Methylophaga lonarensis]EMR12513.1 hypothetical protein MPL1_10012 [Methylophaga lonarensis MPL]